MTRDDDAKREVRARMRVTGERYTQARSALFGPSADGPAATPRPDRRGEAMVDEEFLEALDRNGYAVLRSVVPESLVSQLRERVERRVTEDLEWRLAEVQRRRDAGETDVRAFPRGSEGKFHFRPLEEDRRRDQLADSVADVMQAMGMGLRGSGGIAACMPGWGGHSGLYPDLDGPEAEGRQWEGANATWPLTAWEGMRLVPGSHRRQPVFEEPYAGAIAPHPDEVYVDAGPGDVVITNIHLWKSGTLNRAKALRSEIWITFKSDESLSAKIAAYWARVEIH